MRALRLHEYGNLKNVLLESVPELAPRPGQVAVRNHSSGVNGIDWKIALGYIQPSVELPWVLGWDSAGTVLAVGDGVTRFQPGHRVVGMPDFLSAGAHAEIQLFDEDSLVALPNDVPFAQAATLPVSGLTAWQALFTVGQLQEGQAVLIHAAAGSVGVLAVQLAKQAGAYVVATASEPKHSLVLSLGADQIIDYQTTSFENVVRGMDLVIDTQGGQVQDRSYGALKSGGRLVSLVQPPHDSKLEEYGLTGAMMQAQPDAPTLTELVRRNAAGQLRSVIDSTVPAEDFRSAYDRSMTSRAQGKIVLSWD